MIELRTALVYFGLVFGAGFVLGPIRVLVLAPRVGERTAELVEAPIMVGVILLAARWVVGRWPLGSAAHLGVGWTACALVLAADLAVATGLRGMTPAQAFLERDPVAGAVYYLALLVFALAPWGFSRRGASQGD